MANTLRNLVGSIVYVRADSDAPWVRAEVLRVGRSPGRGRPIAAYCRATGASSGGAWYRSFDVRTDAPSFDVPGIVERMLAGVG